MSDVPGDEAQPSPVGTGAGGPGRDPDRADGGPARVDARRTDAPGDSERHADAGGPIFHNDVFMPGPDAKPSAGTTTLSIERYESKRVPSSDWLARCLPDPPRTVEILDPTARGLVVLVCREDPKAWAAQLASRAGIRTWLVAPTHDVEVDPLTKNPTELADAWVRAAHQSDDRIISCRSVEMMPLFSDEKLGDPTQLRYINDHLVANDLMVILPVSMASRDHLRFWRGLRGPGLSLEVLPWAPLFVRRRATEKGDLTDNDMVEAIASLPAYARSGSLDSLTSIEMEADAKLYGALADIADAAESWSEISAALQQQIDVYRELPLGDFLASLDRTASRNRQLLIENINHALMPKSGGVRDEIAAAMLLVVAFCGKLPPVAFRQVVGAVLPPGPVLSPAQLGAELRASWEREDKANASLKRDRTPLPSWDRVMEHHAYDKAMSEARIVVDGDHVRFSSGYDDQMKLRVEIGARYTSLIDSALTAVVRRAAVLDPGNPHYLHLVELFLQVEAYFPGRIDRAKFVQALTTAPDDSRLEQAKLDLLQVKQNLFRARVDALGAGMNPDDVVVLHEAAAFADEHERTLNDSEDKRRAVLDSIVSNRLGKIIVKMFQVSPGLPDRAGFADRIIEDLASDWVRGRETVLMNALLEAMYENPDTSVDRAWELLRVLYHRLRRARDTDTHGGPGTTSLIENFRTLFRESSVVDVSYVRIWLVACRDRADEDPDWDGIQILAHECMAEIGIRWMPHPYDGKRKDNLAQVILGEDSKRPAMARAIEGFVGRFFGDPALDRLGALEHLMAVPDKETAGIAVTPRLWDVFWILMHGARAEDANAAHRRARALHEMFLIELRRESFPKTRTITELGAAIARCALNRDANAPSSRQVEAAARLAELFRAAILVHWRFEMGGMETLRRDKPVTERFGNLLRLVADARADRGVGLADALKTLAQLQAKFRDLAKAYNEASLAERFDYKSHVIGALADHVRNRNAARKG